jgi:L-lactate dehydrogenase complex protein LldG
MSREAMLSSIREALGRASDAPVAAAPQIRLTVPDGDHASRIQQFVAALEALNVRAVIAADREEAQQYVASLLPGKTAIASNDPFLAECGITDLPEVESGITDLETLRERTAHCDIGITSASYGLADTGTLAMLASEQEARLVSLLPPVHVALLPRERLLSGLDELFTLVPKPSASSSSLVLITGPSRTADIEQILVRGVHGPGEVHVVLV